MDPFRPAIARIRREAGPLDWLQQRFGPGQQQAPAAPEAPMSMGGPEMGYGDPGMGYGEQNVSQEQFGDIGVTIGTLGQAIRNIEQQLGIMEQRVQNNTNTINQVWKDTRGGAGGGFFGR